MLSPDDAAAVLRRAAELDTPALEAHDGLDEQVVRSAAREVGLSDGAVEQAVAEWRAGALAPLPPLPADRRWGLPGSVAVEGRVPVSPEVAAQRLGAWLEAQWFECRRVRGEESEWAPRGGPLASARRAADLDRRLRLRSVDRVRACVAPDAAGARVRLVAQVDGVRSSLLTWGVKAPAVVTGAVVTLALVVPAGSAVPDVLLALPAAAGAGGVGWRWSSSALRTRTERLEEDLERALAELVRPVERPALPDRAVAWARQRLPRGLR